MLDYQVLVLRSLRSLVFHLSKLSLSIQQQVDAIRENSQYRERSEHVDAEHSPPVGPLAVEFHRPVAVTIHGEAKTKTRSAWDWRDWIRFVAELIGLAVLFWYACTTQKLWNESATANHLSKINAIAAQRAYVHFSPSFGAAGSVDPRHFERVAGWFFQVPMENYGLTPTRRMRQHVSWTPSETTLPDSFAYPDTGDQILTHVLLAPRQQLSTTRFLFDSDLLQRTRNGTAHAYVYGWLSYHDVFAGTPEHITKFCYEVRFLNDPFSRTNLAFETNLCPHHNCADEDCNEEAHPSPPNFDRPLERPR
jgi:hypothetical protein